MLTLRVYGHFCLLDENGHDKAPSGQRERAILVALATAPQMTRTRDWLQGNLWSDRSRGQASGSLRTALSNIRRALGQHACYLRADRTRVWIEPETLNLDYGLNAAMESFSVSEPFEDVIVNDAEFEHYIRDLRTTIREQERPTGSGHRLKERLVFVQRDIRGGVIAHMAAEILLGQFREALELTGDIRIVDASSHSASDAKTLSIRLFVAESDGELFLSCQVCVPPEGQTVWSAHAVHSGPVSSLYASDDLTRIALQIADRVLGEVIKHTAQDQTFALAHEAKRLVFQLDRDSLRQADVMFQRAFEAEPRGGFLAWRAFLRNIAFFQHRDSNLFRDDATAHALTVEALRHSPADPVVQSFVSQIDYVHQGSVRTSLSLAQSASDIRRNDPLVLAILSNALAANGSAADSYRVAMRALALARGFPWQYFFEHFACMSAAALGQHELALSHAQTSLRLKPDFASTRRYEIALKLKLMDHAGVQKSLRAMREIEPDFQITTLLEPDYPVTTLRRLPLIEAVA